MDPVLDEWLAEDESNQEDFKRYKRINEEHRNLSEASEHLCLHPHFQLDMDNPYLWCSF